MPNKAKCGRPAQKDSKVATEMTELLRKGASQGQESRQVRLLMTREENWNSLPLWKQSPPSFSYNFHRFLPIRHKPETQITPSSSHSFTLPLQQLPVPPEQDHTPQHMQHMQHKQPEVPRRALLVVCSLSETNQTSLTCLQVTTQAPIFQILGNLIEKGVARKLYLALTLKAEIRMKQWSTKRRGQGQCSAALKRLMTATPSAHKSQQP